MDADLSDGPDPDISVVSPVFHGNATVAALTRQIRSALLPCGSTYEIILVDDACPLGSWQAIRGACAEDPNVRGVRLARNVGQHRALRAGLKRARGRFIAVLDCDLQDDPAHLPEMIARAKEGCDVVYARRPRRDAASLRDWGSRLFYRIFSWLAGTTPFDPRRGMFTVLRRSTVEAVLARQDRHCRYLLTLHGLRLASAEVGVERRPRPSGRSSYSLLRLVRLSWEGILSTHAPVLARALPLGIFLGVSGLAGLVLGAAGVAPLAWPIRAACDAAVLAGILLASVGLTARRQRSGGEEPLHEEDLYEVCECLNGGA